MARGDGKLSALKVQRQSKAGMFADGGGLYLRVSKTGGKSWIFRFMLAGRAREMGLGAFPDIDLAEARIKAGDQRKLLAERKDPIESRKAEVMEVALVEARKQTFRQCAEAYITAHEASWRNAKHKAQWPSTLQAYVYPVFGHLPVQDIDVGLVLKVLEPIWHDKTETARRVRSRIECVLDWATARKYRQGDNPARWRGHLENLLAKPTKIAKVQHHAALPYAEIGGFMAALKGMEGITPLALQFTILTAARTSEALGAMWGEFDLGNAVWTVPANRIKAGREHRVPLSGAALKILQGMAKLRESDDGTAFVFPSRKRGVSLSNMALLAVLKRMQRTDLTAHGFRSTFRDWCAEQTNYPREVAESALAHISGDKVELAYRRGDLFEKRRQLMDAWARYCQTTRTEGTIIKLHGKNTG